MKKFILIFIILFFIVGCSSNDKVEHSKDEDINEKFVLKKVNKDEDYVYFKKYKEVPSFNGEKYLLEIAVLNIQSEDVDNANLEIKSFVTKSFNDFQIFDGIFSQGNIINYESFVTDHFVTLIQKYYLYVDGIVGEEHDNVYVVSLNNGKLYDNSELLKHFDMTEKDLFNLLENKIVSEDIMYTIRNIKDIGYSLYVNNDNKLCIIYYEFDNNESERKELVLN